MLEGRVTASGEPVVPIHLILQKRPSRVSALIDTGFNGYLSVPRPLLLRGGWQAIGTEEFEIATGSIVELEIYLCEVLIEGRRSSVYTIATDAGDILIGTKLLRRNILTVNFRTKRVLIK